MSLQFWLPWMGGLFWIVLLFWVLSAQIRQNPPDFENSKLSMPPGIELFGFMIRQETPYTDDKYTWLELTADRGWNIEGTDGTHQLVNVEVKVVTDKGKKNSKEKDGTSFNSIPEDLDLAWIYIQAATGVYSFVTRNIELEGNVRVYGFSFEGKLTEWVSANKFIYDWQNGQVRSEGPALYEGLSYFSGLPCQGIFRATLDLSSISIDDLVPLSRGEVSTPFFDPSLLPDVVPPEALKFIKKNDSPGQKRG